MSEHVRIYEVGPRDGLQNEAAAIPTATKARFIELLADAGLREIEATSFVAPRAVPQLADADQLLSGLPRRTGVRYPVLVPNLRGLARAEAAGADALAVFTAASDAFTSANIGMTVEESLAAFAPVLARAGELGWWRRGYVSTAFGCPYTGRVDPARAVEVGLRLLELGVDEVCFGDTIGVGVPAQVVDPDRAGRRGRHPARPDRLPLPRHARARPWPTSRPGWMPGSAASTRRPAGPAAARSARARPAISPPRTSSTSSMPPAGSTASRCRASWRPRDTSATPSIGRSRPRSARPAAGTRRPGRPWVARSAPARSGASAIVPVDGRCRTRSEPELRAAERL